MNVRMKWVDEFQLIQRLWQKQNLRRDDVLLGIGDDAAIVNVANQHTLAITTDACLAGVHFFQDTHPKVVARRAFMRTMSDLAAMGAKPAWFTQNITIEKIDLDWLQIYRDELIQLAELLQMQLIGGDMSQGPFAIHLTAFGLLAKNTGLTRAGAKVGDLIVVSGELGGAADYVQNRTSEMQHYYDAPTARIELGMALLNIATACIDISDGLAQDLNHILMASQVGATLDLSAIPKAKNTTLQNALQGGDDYELCFTIPENKKDQLAELAQQLKLPLTIIGEIEHPLGLRDVHLNEIPIKGFKHYEQ